jgi:hypothetical protein
MRITGAASLRRTGPATPMLRAFVYGLTLLHLGPGLAFALLAFGCDGSAGPLGPVCGRPMLSSFALLTVGAWAVLGTALAAVLLVGRARTATVHRTRARLWALLAVLACGASIGAGAAWLTGTDHGVLAIPAALVVAWMFLADPSACTPAPRAGSTPGGTP